jgi:hypothetical protein
MGFLADAYIRGPDTQVSDNRTYQALIDFSSTQLSNPPTPQRRDSPSFAPAAKLISSSTPRPN